MKKTLSGGSILLAILKKDIRVYGRNKIYLFLTVLSLVFFVAVFWLVPDRVDEDFTFALTPALATLVSEGQERLREEGFPEQVIGELAEAEPAFEEEGLLLVELENEEQLVRAIGGEVTVYKTEQGRIIIHDPEIDQEVPENAERVNLDIGLALPPTFLSDVMLEQKPEVTVYADAAVPEEIRNALQGLSVKWLSSWPGTSCRLNCPMKKLSSSVWTAWANKYRCGLK